MKTFVLALSLVGMLAMAVWGAAYVWSEIGDTQMSTTGILAMIAGIVLSLGLGMGLMFLVFKSEHDGTSSK